MLFTLNVHTMPLARFRSGRHDKARHYALLASNRSLSLAAYRAAAYCALTGPIPGFSNEAPGEAKL